MFNCKHSWGLGTIKSQDTVEYLNKLKHKHSFLHIHVTSRCLAKNITQFLIEREAALFVFPPVEGSTLYVVKSRLLWRHRGICVFFLLENKSSQFGH